jgi:hypothetical protein
MNPQAAYAALSRQGVYGAVAISTRMSATGAELFTFSSEGPMGGKADAGSQYHILHRHSESESTPCSRTGNARDADVRVVQETKVNLSQFAA